MPCDSCHDTGWVMLSADKIMRSRCPKGCPIQDKPSADTTMFVSVLDETGKQVTHVVRNFNVTAFTVHETVEFTLHTALLKDMQLGKKYSVAVMATKDPTPCDANAAVSLGFFRFRWALHGTFIEYADGKEPYMKFRGWIQHYKTDVLMEMWDYD